MEITIIELQETFASRRWDGIMPAILGVWAEREGWSVRVHFTPFDEVDFDEECDVVAVSAYTYLARECYEVARRFRDKGKLVVLGGPHTKGCAGDARLFADAVFQACDEDAWRGFLRGVSSGAIARSDPGVVIPSKELVAPPPYREYRRFMGRKKIPLLLSSLGCPYTCDFCADWDKDFVKRDVDAVLADVRDVDRPYFVFIDPNFGVNPGATAELLRRMVPLGKRYFMQCSFSFLMDERILELLRESGCLGVQIGLESFSTPFTKNAVRPESSILEDTIAKIRKIKEYVPFVHTNIILGFDDDTEETFEAVREFHRRSSVDVIMPHIATPYPGTPLHERMAREGRIFDWNEAHYDSQHLVITLKGMRPDRFYDLYVELYAELRSFRAAFTKALGQWRDSRSLRRSLLVFAFLARKAVMTRRFEFPELLRARRGLAREAYDRASAGKDARPLRGDLVFAHGPAGR